MDIKVKNYLDSLPSPQKEIGYEIRRIIFKTYHEIIESFENGVPWYECKYYIAAFKDHVNIGFSVEHLTEEEMKVFGREG